MIGSFKVNCTSSNDYNKTIVLVDDVYTSGATINECAKVLRNAGARDVWVVAFARG